jgi:hypothetical protein
MISHATYKIAVGLPVFRGWLDSRFEFFTEDDFSRDLKNPQTTKQRRLFKSWLDSRLSFSLKMISHVTY